MSPAPSDVSLEHFHVEPVSVMDAHSGGAHLTFTTGIVFSGVVDEADVRTAVKNLARAWPMLGSRLRCAGEGPAIELLVPDSEHAVLATTINAVPKCIQDVETLYTRTNTISTQRITRNLDLYYHVPQPTVDEFISSQSPGFHLYVSCLLDATIFTLTFPHVLMDASGVGAFMRGLVAALEGGPLLPHLEGDPWGFIFNDAPSRPLSDIKGWTTYGPSEFAAAADTERADLQTDGPIRQRSIYFPLAEIERLKTEAMDQIHSAGLPVPPVLSSGDVIVAWLYKHFYGDERYSPERTSRLLYVLDARLRLPDIFTPDTVYLKNGYLVMPTDAHPNAHVRDTSLGELALMVRNLVTAHSTYESIVDQMRWKYDHVGEVQVPASAGERVMFASNWLTFGLGELSIANVMKPGSGTGRVLDVYCGMPGIPRCSGVVTFRDSDGGVMAAFDWAERNWTTGTIGEYAIERLDAKGEAGLGSESRIYSLLSWVSRFLRF